MILNYMKKFWMGGWKKLFILTKCCLVSCLEGRQWVLFVLRRLAEKFRSEGKRLFYAFSDLEKAFDRVLQEEIY